MRVSLIVSLFTSLIAPLCFRGEMLSQIQSPVSTSLHLRSLSFIRGGCSLCGLPSSFRNGRSTAATTPRAVSRRVERKRDEKANGKGVEEEKFEEIMTKLAESSGIGARERRMIKVREAKRQKEYERKHHYPQWAKFVFLISSESFLFIKIAA
jgi:hypothetical protein